MSALALIRSGGSLHDFASIDLRFLSRCDKRQQTVLHEAVRFNRLDLAAYILERVPNVNQGNVKGITPLHYAAKNGNRDMIHLLQRFGARQMPTRYRHEWPIHYAVEARNAHVFNLLADGINDFSTSVTDEPRLAAMTSGTPLQMAIRRSALKGSLACVEALIRLGANVHLID